MKSFTTFTIFVLLLVMGMGFGREFKNKRGHKHMDNDDITKEKAHSAQSPQKGLADSWQSDADGGYMSSQDICDSWWCGQGQECRPGGDSLPSCVCKEVCPVPLMTTKKQDSEWDLGGKEELPDQGAVCGTDGIVYPSECELYRSGCLTANIHLQVVGGPEACEKINEEGDVPSEEDYGQESPNVMQPHPQPDKNPCRNRDNNSPVGRSRKLGKDAPSPPTRPGMHKPDMEIPPEQEDDEEDEEFHTDKDDYPVDDDYQHHDRDDCSSLKKMRKSIKNMKRRKSSAVSETKRNTKKRKRGSTLCTSSEYKIFKEALLKYNQKHLVPSFHLDEDKEKLISRVFGHFDHNHDGSLDYGELQKIGFEESLGRPQLRCHPVEFLHFDDANQDSTIDPNEFEAAFTASSFSSTFTGVSKKKATRKPLWVKGKVGEKLELRCPFLSSSSSPPQWSRYGHPLEGLAAGVLIQEDGTLLSIPVLELAHAGNFSCAVEKNFDETQEQTYLITVSSEPEVQVYPHMILERPGARIRLECRVKGEPLPSIRWLKNDAPLSPLLIERNKYNASGPFLEVENVGVADTGAYMCEGSNTAGIRVDIASILVLDEYVEFPSAVKSGIRNESLFVILHEGGISMYDPHNCRLRQEILGTDIIPGTQRDLVCGSSPCVWGSGVLIPSSYIYVSQPLLDRVLVVSLSEMVVVDVVPTISTPSNLYYVPHADQVWIHGKGGVQVVHDAKEKKKHGATTVNIVGANPVRSIFLPKAAPFMSVYLTKENVRGMYKVDLRSATYLKSVDLSGFNCLPDGVHFAALYGFLILECREPVLRRPTGTLLLDSATDAVIEHLPHLHGRSHLSPDDRWLITLTPRRTKNKKAATDFVVHQITQSGLVKRYTVRSSINASDLAFFPSQTFQSYDIFSSSQGASHHDEHLLYIDLSSGRTELVPGVGKFSSSGSQQRPIEAQSGNFDNFLATPGSGSAFVVNGRSRTVNCQIGGGPLHNISSILWLHGQFESTK